MTQQAGVIRERAVKSKWDPDSWLLLHCRDAEFRCFNGELLRLDRELGDYAIVLSSSI
jgi:hypothetical protein